MTATLTPPAARHFIITTTHAVTQTRLMQMLTCCDAPVVTYLSQGREPVVGTLDSVQREDGSGLCFNLRLITGSRHDYDLGGRLVGILTVYANVYVRVV